MPTPIRGAAADAGAQMIDGIRVPTEVRLMLVDELLPYARNSRRHDPAQIEAIAANMRRVGFTNPILIADGGILAGHGRLLAAKSLGLSRAPCIDLSHLSEADRRAQIIWDNRSAELGGGWDLAMLKLETDDLRSMGLDLEAVTGFSEEALADLFRDIEEPPPPETDPNDAPALPAEPVVVTGDTWVCGPHRVHCGDACDMGAWGRLMAGELADICWTDPPYNVDLETKNRRIDKAIGGVRSAPPAIANDRVKDDGFADLLAGAYRGMFAALKSGASVYVAHSDKEADVFRAEFEKAGFVFSQTLIWRKNCLVLGMARYLPIHEPIMVGRKPGSRSRWYGGRKQTTVVELGESSPFRQDEDGRWLIQVGDQVLVVSGDAHVEALPGSMVSVPKPAKSGLHQSQKPVELIERMLHNSARPGDVVLDAFGGSGSTLVAADRLGMSARIMELEPAFCEVIVRRWEMLTGRRAVHAVTGEPFPREGEGRAQRPDPAADADTF